VTGDVIVVGSGVVGACCAYELARAGLDVTVVDRGHLTSGTTASGEGNLLVSDKHPGPELDLALHSLARWARLSDELDLDFEFEAKGGVVVAADDDEAAMLADFAADQSSAGVRTEPADPAELRELEPHISRDLPFGVHYPQDAQLQPVLASSSLLRRAREHGATLSPDTSVAAIEPDPDGLALLTSRGRMTARWVVNAAGPWAGHLAALAGARLPVAPRRGHVLVTEPLPPTIRHKVYEAGYVGTLSSDPGQAQVSSVVEGTPSGTVLLGSSREFVGFDRRQDGEIIRRIAARAVSLFPVLAGVRLMRSYCGFRPWVPDHTPVIGEDPAVPGLVHATGHEGAGIGLAAATGDLVRAVISGEQPALDLDPFRADRPSLHEDPDHE
jgi:D-hydroxyproline dehydrogenase subunit beta